MGGIIKEVHDVYYDIAKITLKKFLTKHLREMYVPSEIDTAGINRKKNG